MPIAIGIEIATPTIDIVTTIAKKINAAIIVIHITFYWTLNHLSLLIT